MRSAFTGAFAPYICGLIEKKQALGYDYHGSACILRTFDEFCREQFPNETCLTAELAMKWAEQSKTEKNLSRLNRVSVVRELAKYMNTEMKRQAIQKVSKVTEGDTIEPIWANDEELIKRLYGLA